MNRHALVVLVCIGAAVIAANAPAPAQEPPDLQATLDTVLATMTRVWQMQDANRAGWIGLQRQVGTQIAYETAHPCVLRGRGPSYMPLVLRRR